MKKYKPILQLHINEYYISPESVNRSMLFHFRVRPTFSSDRFILTISLPDLHSAPADPHPVSISSRECPERSAQPVRSGGKRQTGLRQKNQKSVNKGNALEMSRLCL